MNVNENDLKLCKHGFNIYCEMLAAPTGFRIEKGRDFSYITGDELKPTMVIFNVDIKENHQESVRNIVKLIKSGKISNHYELIKEDILFEALKENGFSIYQDDKMLIMDITDYSLYPVYDDIIDVSLVKSTEDLKHWININQANWGHLYNENQWEEIYVLDNVKMYLTRYNNIPASSMLTITDGSACIELLHTLEEYRKKGLATAMIKQALIDLKNYGVSKVTIQTGAVELFNKIGFSIVCDKYIARLEKVKS